jgi:glycerol-3-phosphate dehydrogenase
MATTPAATWHPELRMQRSGAYRRPPSLDEGKRVTAPTLLGEGVASFLLMFFGTGSIVALTGAAAPDPPDLLPIALCRGFAVAAEVVHAHQHEAARTLEDVLLRRTMVGLGPTAGLGPDRAAAEVAREHLGWDAARAEAEVAAFREHAKTMRPREALVRGG